MSVEVPRLRTAHERRAVEERKLVESTNTLEPAVFFTKYLPNELMDSICNHHRDGLPRLTSICQNASALKGPLLDGCFQLIEKSSAEDYQKSEMKWSSAKKKKEMALPDMRYILLQTERKTGAQALLAGFVSFMITYEDGQEVIYCYEIHLAENWQGRGLGKKLMGVVEEIGKKVGWRSQC